MSTPPPTRAEILARAARALGRIDRDGHRALTALSVQEVEAMALALLLLGLAPVPPGAPRTRSETLSETPSQEASNEL